MKFRTAQFEAFATDRTTLLTDLWLFNQ